MAEPARPGATGPGPASPFPTASPHRRLPGPLVLWVGLGGALGVLLNAGTHALLDGPGAALFGPAAGSTPAMVVANLLGAFLLGLLNGRARTSRAPWDERVTAALGTGVLGAYTSFSALAALLGTPVTAALSAPGTASAERILGGLGAGLLLVAAVAAAGTLCAWAGLRAGSRSGAADPAREAAR
ncbi:CrcB family protein [Micrococcus lylae]|uniref:Fluoride ion transporter CrcB n=1 Tax=Micrococcus lylae TaxID=1273 RepID=A0ABY2K637_9MICC|nr:CrcB family protein [Micrococcus lylae]TFI01465.1 hypothetical protein E4A49_00060 [Micrococcus lylae]